MTLPEGWVEATIEDVTSYVSRGRSPKYVDLSDMPVVNQRAVRWSGVEAQHLKFIDPATTDQWSDERTLRRGDVLWNSTGTGTIGRAALYRPLQGFDRVVADSHVTVVRAVEEIEASYIFQLIRSPAVQTLIDDMQSGSTNQVELSRKAILETRVPLPPVAEQRRIVAKLDALTARLARARAELDRVPVLAEQVRSASLYAAFSLPVPTVRISDVSIRVTKGSSPRWQGYEYQSEGTLFVRSQNVRWGKLALADRVYLPTSFNEKARNSVIHAGDVLLNIVGASIGRAAIATRELANANCNQAVCIIRPADVADAQYLMLFLISPRAQIAIIDGSVDVARANFSLAQAKSLSIPWPSESQRAAVVEKLEAAFARADRLEAEAARARALLDRLESAILAKAFRGELVPQDPADEPASVLLDRIRAQRAAAPKPKRGRRAASADAA